jgi:hypothetical protein
MLGDLIAIEVKKGVAPARRGLPLVKSVLTISDRPASGVR